MNHARNSSKGPGTGHLEKRVGNAVILGANTVCYGGKCESNDKI